MARPAARAAVAAASGGRAADDLLPVPDGAALPSRDPGSGDRGFTAAHYVRPANTPVYWRILGITFRIALLTALFSVLLGYPLALWLSRMESRRQAVLPLVVLPFWTSYLVKTFARMILLDSRGVLNTLFLDLGLSERLLLLMYNDTGVLIGMVHAMMPLAVLTMLPVMNGIDRRLTLVAGSLGAGRAQRFSLVYFPLSMPGAAAVGLLTLITSLGFFIVPAFLGGRQQTMLAQTIITRVQELVSWSFAAVPASFMVAAALISIWVHNRFFGLSAISGGASSGDVPAGGALLRRARRSVLRAMAGLTRPLDRLGARDAGDRPGNPVYPILALLFLIAPTLVVFPLAFTSVGSLQFPPPGYLLRWLFFHGRMTDSVRCKGENVSAYEVESVASARPQVLDAAMVGVPAEIGEYDIQIFVQPQPGTAPAPAEIWSWMAGQLAPHQRPRYIAPVTDFPRTPSQRIQKHLLTVDPDPMEGAAAAQTRSETGNRVISFFHREGHVCRAYSSPQGSGPAI